MMKSQRKHHYKEVVLVVIFFMGIAGIAFWQIATSFAEQGADSGTPFDNAAMFPRLVAAFLVGLSLVQIGISLMKRDQAEPDNTLEPFQDTPKSDEVFEPVLQLDDSDPTLDSQPPEETQSRLLLRALGCLAVFIVYLTLVTTTGYILGTILMLLSMFMILGTSLLLAFVVATTATLTTGFVFDSLLGVVLPIGQLGLPTLF